MDQDRLRRAAANFEQVATRMSATVPLAGSMLKGLHSIIARIKEGTITSPLERRDIPYGYMHADGELRPYPELANAYAELSLALCDIKVPAKLPWQVQ